MTSTTSTGPKPAPQQTPSTPSLGRWEKVWFLPARPLGLIVTRWLVFSTVIVDIWQSRGAIQSVPAQARALWEPVSVLAILDVPRPTSAVMAAAAVLAIGGCALALSGLAPRATGLVGATAYAVFVMAENSLGKVSHGQQPAVIMALIVAVAAVPRISDPPSWRYRWPVQLCRVSLAGMLFAAAWAKVTTSGLSWVFTDHLRNMLVADALLHRSPPLQGLSLWIASEPWRWQVAAAGALVGEATLIAALVVRSQPVRALLVVNGVGTIIGISLLVGLVGFPIVGLALVMLDVERLHEVWHDRWARIRWFVVASGVVAVLALTMYLHRPSWPVCVPPLAAATALLLLAPRAQHAPFTENTGVLVYDADCGFCTRFAAWLAAGNRVSVAGWHEIDLSAAGLTPAMVSEAAYWLRDGRAVAAGADAIGQALVRRNGWARLVGELILCPPVRPVARIVYRTVARNRYRLPGGTQACAAPFRSPS